MDDPVQRQYEAYPYPQRDPRDEAKRLITGSPSNLLEINHYLFGGRRDFTQPFRALVAGGGTGDATVMLAQQLADAGGPGAVVYLDISAAAREIAEARVAARGLDNVRFVTGTIEELTDSYLGPFDYIDCCGVLHHLADPLAGLRALTDALAEDGGIGLMVYGEYGRTGLYPLQEVLHDICAGLPLDEQIGLARRLIESLPPTNWFHRNELLSDHKRSDAELIDLCLHPRDRAYRVPELLELLRDAGLAVIDFIEPLRYEPATYVTDAQLLRRLEHLSPLQRAATAERLAGNMRKHIAYLMPAERPGELLAATRAARPDGPTAIPVLREVDGKKLASMLDRDPTLRAEVDGLQLACPLPRLAPAMLAQIDGRAYLAEIHRALQQRDPSLDWEAFKAQFDRLFEVIGGLNRLLIRFPV